MPRNFSHAGIKSGFLVNFSVANGHAEKYMACIFRYIKYLIHNNL